MIGVPLGLLYWNAGEWLIHKYVLHGAGKRKKSFWSFHWNEHHRHVRQHDFYDPDYERATFAWHAQGKEALGLVGVALLHAPLFPIAPFFTATIWYSAYRYHAVHKRSHLDPAWAAEHLPWHVDHHLGSNQDANWCVTHPWFDNLMGTRKTFVGTAEAMAKMAKRRPAAPPRHSEPPPPHSIPAPSAG